MKRIATIVAAALFVSSVALLASQAKPEPAAQPPAAPVGLTPPADYVIGAGDILIINYWKEPEMSTDSAVVRPDGMITLPLLNDVQAQGLKPEQLATRLTDLSSKQGGLVDPRVTVGVKAINSRKVHITGGVLKPGQYDLLAPMDVVELISIAGGLREFVDGKRILILRTESGKPTALRFNYKEVLDGRNLGQNIPLKPGDRVLVPE